MFIEQTLMRSTKIRGGLTRGRSTSTSFMDIEPPCVLKLQQFFEDLNPFDSQCVELQNVFSGLVDGQHKVTADEAKLIGTESIPN